VRLEQVLLQRRQEDYICNSSMLNTFPLISVLKGSLEIPKNNLSGSWPVNTTYADVAAESVLPDPMKSIFMPSTSSPSPSILEIVIVEIPPPFAGPEPHEEGREPSAGKAILQ